LRYLIPHIHLPSHDLSIWSVDVAAANIERTLLGDYQGLLPATRVLDVGILLRLRSSRPN